MQQPPANWLEVKIATIEIRRITARLECYFWLLAGGCVVAAVGIILTALRP